MRKTLVLASIFFALPVSTASAESFYVDNTCAHNGNGTAQACASGSGQPGPWNSIANIRWGAGSESGKVDAGDYLLLKRGCIFREAFIVERSGTSGNPITIGAYGEGDRPIIMGSIDASSSGYWTDLGSNKYATPSDFPKSTPMLYYNTNSKPDNPDYGTKVTNEIDLDTNWEFWWDNPNDRVIVYLGTGNPATQADGIEIPEYDQLSGWLVFVSGEDYIKLSDLQINYARTSGLVNYQGDNNEFSNIDFKFVYDKAFRNDESNNVLIQNIRAHRCGIKGKLLNSGGENFWLALGSGITVRNCDINIPHAVAINAWHADSVTIENCNIHDGDLYPNAWHAGVYFDGCTNSAAKFNKVANNPVGYSVNAETGGSSSYNISFVGNIAYNCKTSFIINCNQGSIRNTNIYAYNNVFYRAQNPGASYINVNLRYVDGLNFKNNIIADAGINDSSILRWYNNDTTNVNSDYNNWYAGRYHFNLDSAYYSSFSSYQSGTGQDAHSISADPKFANASGGHFNLQAASPAIGAGVNLGDAFKYAMYPLSMPPNAIPADQNSYGIGWEIGAYVYTAPVTITIDGVTYPRTDAGIEQAIADAMAGDSIYMPAGTYALSGDIDIPEDKDNLTIYGDGDSTILQLADGVNDHCIKVNGADGLTLRNFRIDGNKASQTAISNGINTGWYTDNLTIRYLTITDTYSDAVFVNGGRNALIEYNTIISPGQAGIIPSSQGAGVYLGNCKDSAIRFNNISGSLGNGVFISGSNPYDSSNITTEYNDISNLQSDQTSSIHAWEIRNSSIRYNHLHDNPDRAHGINAIFVRGLGGNTAANTEVKYNNIYHVSGVGIEVQDAGCTLEHNIIDLLGTGSDAQGIYLANDADNTAIRYNDLRTLIKHGLYFADDVSRVLVEYNSFRNAPNPMALIRFVGSSGTGTDITIRNNLLYGNQASPTTLYGIYATGASANWTNLRIYSNNLWNLLNGIEFNGVGTIADSEIKNNILYLPNVKRAMNLESSGFASDYNLIYPATTNYLKWGATEYSSFASWQSGTGQDAHSLNSNPLFANPSAGDFHLQSASPAIDAGVDVGLTQDFEGVPVPQGLAPDIGAFEYAAHHRADKNEDGCVEMEELSAFIDLWNLNSQDVTIRELMEAIGLWKGGCS